MADLNARTEELENIFLILAALEDNLAQYMNIKNQVIEASFTVQYIISVITV